MFEHSLSIHRDDGYIDNGNRGRLSWRDAGENEEERNYTDE
jgi:hypothetical protein